MPTRKVTRRQWLKRSAALAAGVGAAAAAPVVMPARAFGAADAVRIGVIGIRLRGGQLVDQFRRLPGVRVTAICDADTALFAGQLKKFDSGEEKVAAHVDFRRILDDPRIDAVAIASPDHWHALMTVWACQAGKDVYVEKPVSYNISEGRKMVEAARTHKRIVQTGTQNRSDTGLKAALAYLAEGPIGRMRLGLGFDFTGRRSIGTVDGPQPIPETVNYDLFRGPAPLVPLLRKTFHYDWHWFWDTGTGDCGNRGVHTFDMLRWFTGQKALPPRVVSIGGRFGWDDNGETPNTQITLFAYEPVPIIWEMTSLPRRQVDRQEDRFRGNRASMMFDFEGGYLCGHRGGARVHAWDHKLIRAFKGDGGRTHYANFIDAVRSRKAEDLEADILEGHLSSALCHLANVSYLLGRHRPTDAVKEAVGDHPVLGPALEDLLGNLTHNGVDLAKIRPTHGATLTLDTEKERFVGEAADWANMYLERTYRRPFVMPENV